MRFRSPTTTVHSVPLSTRRAAVDEDAVTLRLRPLRWRDRMLPELIRWGSATGTVAAVAGAWLVLAAPPEAAHARQAATSAEPMAPPQTEDTPVLASARRDASWAQETSIDEEDEIIIILDDEEDEDEEIVIFDDTLDGPSAAAMAEVHLDLQEPALALQYAILAAEQDPRNPTRHARVGEAHMLAGDHVAARRAFRRARRLRR